jgi:hypothetical protein
MIYLVHAANLNYNKKFLIRILQGLKFYFRSDQTLNEVTIYQLLKAECNVIRALFIIFVQLWTRLNGRLGGLH